VITGLPTPGSAVVSVLVAVVLLVAVAALLDEEVVVWLLSVWEGDDVVPELPHAEQAAATSTAAARRATVVAEPGRCIDGQLGRC
jgi:hypothetical protein